MTKATDTRMTDQERLAYARDGYLLREAVFPENELAALRAAAEDVEQRIRKAAAAVNSSEITLPDGHRLAFASDAAVQWEWNEGSQEIRIVEPIDHLHPRFEALFHDPRLADPARDALGHDQVVAFTSKLNLKRGRDGSRFPWHQDFPYWYVRVEDHANDVMTALLLLDDADVENGALRVLPGSHLEGPAPRDPNDPLKSLADPGQIDASSEVVLEAPAGSMVFFGSLLLHRSSPNESGRDRRALLPSFQPAGRPHWRQTPFRPELIERLP